MKMNSAVLISLMHGIQGDFVKIITIYVKLQYLAIFTD